MKNKIRNYRKQTFITFLASRILISVMILLPFQKSFGQFPDDFLLTETPKADRYEFPEPETQFNLSLENEDFPVIYGSGNKYADKAEPAHNSIPDSIYEFRNFGYYYELYRWYYKYNEQHQPDTVWRYFFNANAEFENITEIRTYNTEGQLLKLVKRQPDFQEWQFNGDSSLIDIYTEEYHYEDGNLVQKITVSREYTEDQVTNEYYTYDEEGKVIHSITEEYGNQYESDYYYAANDNLKYVLFFSVNNGDETYYNVTKYEYEETDTTKQITHYEFYGYNERPILDTITLWQIMDRYVETYDPAGRRTSVTLIRNNIYYGERMDYKAEFTWSESSQLLHTSYFTWKGNMDTGMWEEAIKIDNSYDESGNLLLYEKTFFDARTGDWETENSKTYYYASVPAGLPANITNPGSLSIFPNPAENLITVRDFYGETLFYTVYNLYGIARISGRLENKAINVSHLKPGIYIIEIRDGHSIYTGKFVKY